MTPDSSQANDLGLGRVLSDTSRARVVNRDGTLNVERVGVGFWRSHSLYHDLTAMSWPWFFAMLALSYLGANALFAAGFWALGPAALDAPATDGDGTGFLRAFYFSVQTFATIGYGRIAPVGHAAEMLVAVEAFLGIVYVALATGLIFARFSRPSPDVRFSTMALVAPYQDGWALMFRLANARRANLFDLDVQVTYSILETNTPDGKPRRQYLPLDLERHAVNVFPTMWTVVHPITPDSPLHGLTPNDLVDGDVEVFVRLAALDEATMQTVQVRTSYRADEGEVVWHARFRDLHDRSGPRIRVDVTRLDEHDPV